MSKGDVLVQFVIHERPRDFPGHFVVRAWEIARGSMRAHPVASLCNSLEEARAEVPPGLYRLGRRPNDDPTIVEVWT